MGATSQAALALQVSRSRWPNTDGVRKPTPDVSIWNHLPQRHRLWLPPEASTPRPAFPSTFAQAEVDADRFEEVLTKHGVAIPEDSELRAGCLAIRALRTRREMAERYQDDLAGLRSALQMALGTQHLIRLVLRRAEHPEFGALVPHLRLLTNGSAATTVKADVTDRNAAKIFELTVALAALSEGRDLCLDDPQHSKGGNPDVLVRLGRDDRLWGLACKVMSSESPLTLLQRIEEGAAQIERSPADVGVVVLSMKNILPHTEILPQAERDDGRLTLGAASDKRLLSEFVQGEVNRRIFALLDAVGRTEVGRVVRAFGKALPAILVPVYVGAALVVENQPMPMLYGYGHICDLSRIHGQFLLQSTLRAADIRALAALVRGFEVG